MSSETQLVKFMCLPRLSKTHLDGLMTRPDARSCHQTNFSDGGFVRKDTFSNFPFLFFFLLFPFVLFSRCPYPARGPFFKGSLASWMFT